MAPLHHCRGDAVLGGRALVQKERRCWREATERHQPRWHRAGVGPALAQDGWGEHCVASSLSPTRETSVF